MKHSGKGVASGVEKLRLRPHSGEWPDRLLPGIVQLLTGDLLLARKNLPKSNIGLKDPDRVATERVIGNLVYRLGSVDGAHDGCVVQLGELREDHILIAVLLEPPGQESQGLRL